MCSRTLLSVLPTIHFRYYGILECFDRRFCSNEMVKYNVHNVREEHGSRLHIVCKVPIVRIGTVVGGTSYGIQIIKISTYSRTAAQWCQSD